MIDTVKKLNSPLSEAEWKKRLTPRQYAVLRQRQTEKPFTGKLLHNKAKGHYVCAACKEKIFDSTTKFESNSGWPSFYDVISQGAVKLLPDNSMGLERVEVVCGNCNGHLGHVFDDVPELPTGKYYCINSTSLNFQPSKS